MINDPNRFDFGVNPIRSLDEFSSFSIEINNNKNNPSMIFEVSTNNHEGLTELLIPKGSLKHLELILFLEKVTNKVKDLWPDELMVEINDD